MRAFLFLALVLGVVPADAATAWLQYVSGGHVAARTLADPSCPSILVDGRGVAMRSRGMPPAGQRLVCEFDVTGAQTVIMAGTTYKLPGATPQHIVVLGDTGCRLKTEAPDHAVTDDADDDESEGTGAGPEGGKTKIQNCNDPAQWPFATVARAAAGERPDLVIHVGDYVYRESACPADYARDCANSPVGDHWETWDADFFSPARPLLAAAPWVFVRGNHEICARGGKGWFYYFGPDAYRADQPCIDNVTSYTIRVGAFRALVLDSSGAPDASPTPAQVDAYARQFRAAQGAGLSHAWLLSHRPIWAAKAGVKGDRSALRTLNATLEQAWAVQPLPGVDLVVSGHTHLFELMAFAPPLPLQLVIGNGGTLLAHAIKGPLTGQSINSAVVAQGQSSDAYGYALFEPGASGRKWRLHVRDTQGADFMLCHVARNEATCQPGPRRVARQGA